MNSIIKRLNSMIAVTLLVSNSFVFAGGTMSRAVLPQKCIDQITQIRDEYKQEILTEKTLETVPGAEKKLLAKRLTIIIPYESEPTARDRSGSMAMEFGGSVNPKVEKLMGRTPSPSQIAVAFGSWKGRIRNLVNSEELSEEQKLEVIKILCEPCDGYRFIDGDIEKITSVKPSQVRKISASLIKLESGILIITCVLKNGEQILCYI